jgi:hypothetical protein
VIGLINPGSLLAPVNPVIYEERMDLQSSIICDMSTNQYFPRRDALSPNSQTSDFEEFGNHRRSEEAPAFSII